VIARYRPSQRRLDSYDWRGPPERIEFPSVSDHERHLITAIALQRLKAARLELDRTRLRSHPMEKSQ
jgi:hypothetical protein